MDNDDYIWGYLDGGPPATVSKKKIYKIWWEIAIRHTDDGYFYKVVPIQKGFKYTSDYWEAKQILEKVNAAIQLLGMADKATTGILEEEE